MQLLSCTKLEDYRTPKKIHQVTFSEQHIAPDIKAALLKCLPEEWSKDKQLPLTMGHIWGMDSRMKPKLFWWQKGLFQRWLNWDQHNQRIPELHYIPFTVSRMQHCYANDTYIIGMSVYYAIKLFNEHSERWMKTGPDTFLPVHKKALGSSFYYVVPFIHSFLAIWTETLWSTIGKLYFTCVYHHWYLPINIRWCMSIFYRLETKAILTKY